MTFLQNFIIATAPALLAWALLWRVMTKYAISPRLASAASARIWDAEEERTRTKRLNAILEQDHYKLAA